MKNYLALVIGVLLLSTSCGANKMEKNELKRINVAEAKKVIDENKGNKNFIVVDIRTLEEYTQERIAGAINIDFYSPKFNEQLTKLDKNKKYLIYCRSGNRSAKALSMMQTLDFKNVYELEGGITAWDKEGGAIVK